MRTGNLRMAALGVVTLVLSGCIEMGEDFGDEGARAVTGPAAGAGVPFTATTSASGLAVAAAPGGPGPAASGGPGAAGAGRHSGPPPARMALSGGVVIVGGPRGFCIDRDVSHEVRRGTSLVVLAGCGRLGGGLLAPRPAAPALLTAAVPAAAAARPLAVAAAGPALAQWVASAQGLAALSRSGQAATVRVLETRTDPDAFLIRLTDTAPFPGGPVAAEYWRAITVAGDRTVILSVLAPGDRALDHATGLGLIRDFVASVKQATAQGIDGG